MLARGAYLKSGSNIGGGSKEVELEVEGPAENRENRTKMKALEIVRRNGPIKKLDPNAAFGSRRFNSVSSKTELQKSSCSSSVSSGSGNSTAGTGSNSPLKKRTKLGDIKLDREDMKAILNKKSSHQAELDEEDAQRQEQYFSLMETKEKIETRMTEITEVKNCNVITCKKCCYTWHAQSDHCKRQGHVIQRHSADKRYFKCKTCGTRTVSYGVLPNRACRKCSESNWERTGMREERRGPKLDSEVLKIRGDEEPFANR